MCLLVKVFIFARAIRDCPMFFEVTRHNSPLLSYGSHGTGEHSFIQPCSLALDVDNRIFVVDTGNSRVKVLDTKFELLDHIRCPALEGRSVTGVCLGVNKDTLVTVNWRTKVVAEINFQGTQVMRRRISLSISHVTIIFPGWRVQPQGDGGAHRSSGVPPRRVRGGGQRGRDSRF